MSTLNFTCFYCMKPFVTALDEDTSVSYEENKTEGGKTFSETFLGTCKCGANLRVKVTQHLSKGNK